MSAYKLTILFLGACALAGCGGGQTIPDPDPIDETAGMDEASTSGGDFEEWGEGEEFEDIDRSAGELGMVIYFEFDSSEVRAADTDLISRHAIQLADNPSARVRLEGHADERGSREYNIGLGERRSQAVRRLLLIQGASASQISTVSFGEERPANPASNEDAWAENRRVEIVYTN